MAQYKWSKGGHQPGYIGIPVGEYVRENRSTQHSSDNDVGIPASCYKFLKTSKPRGGLYKKLIIGMCNTGLITDKNKILAGI